MVIVAILAVLLFAAAGALVFVIVREPQARRSENLDQIDAYGYTARVAVVASPQKDARRSLDEVASRIGNALTRRTRRLHEDEIQRELIAAGFFNIGARRFLGYRVLFTIALPILLIWFFALLGASPLELFLIAVVERDRRLGRPEADRRPPRPEPAAGDRRRRCRA